MGKLSLSKMVCIVSMFCAVTAMPSLAQTFTTLVNFNGANGAYPETGLVLGTDGNFYGMTTAGGTRNNCSGGCGTVFKITPPGTLTTLYSLCTQSGCPDGYVPDAVLVQATDGNLYGTTSAGGANGYGTIFKITPGGTLTTLHSFDPFVEGAASYGGLIQGTDGNLYGTASGYGGHNCSATAYGT